MLTLEERFWKKVDTSGGNGCWAWTGRKDRRGRGQIGHVRRFAHRVSWELANGPIPDSLIVCHHCDNPNCVNPAHLFLGTQADNMRDMREKGRQARHGATNTHGAKLIERDVQIIRVLAGIGCTHREIAARYRIDPSTVGLIVRRVTWRDVPDYGLESQ